MPGAQPVSLYVHLPWCVAKCPYCDFNSFGLRGELPERTYTDALLADLELAVADVPGRPLASVFFGGGTPSLFSPSAIGEVLEQAARLMPVADDLEVTMEANPGASEHSQWADYLAAGVNRLSLGAQTFSDKHLKVLGRIHSSGEIVAAARSAREAGFTRLNLDLMYGLPGQDEEGALADLQAALELEPSHLSHYQLTLEPDTHFYKKPPTLPDEDPIDAMLAACEAELGAHGFSRYEISAWAQPGEACRHNLNYWRFGDYLGIGAGAHGKVTLPSGEVVRTRRQKNPTLYQQAEREKAVIREIVPAADLGFEYLLNCLRLEEGFKVTHFEQATGQPASLIEAGLSRADDLGLLIEAKSGHYLPTEKGRRFLNDLQALFLPGD